MVLPNAKDIVFLCVILPDPRGLVLDTLKDRIVGIRDLYKLVLILDDSALTLLGQFEVVKSDEI